jgi:hypothetical protein
MEKISGIIPASPRVSSVDLKEATAVRSGALSFGRPQAVAAGGKNLPTYDTTARTSARIQQDMMDWRSKESRQAAIATEMSNRFFMNNAKPAEPVVDVDQPSVVVSSIATASRPAGFKTDGVGSLIESVSARGRIDPGFESAEIEDEISLPQPEGLFPKGSFIDRTA